MIRVLPASFLLFLLLFLILLMQGWEEICRAFRTLRQTFIDTPGLRSGMRAGIGLREAGGGRVGLVVGSSYICIFAYLHLALGGGSGGDGDRGGRRRRGR